MPTRHFGGNANYEPGIMDKEDIFESIEGWNAYAMHANTYKFRRLATKKQVKALKRIDKGTRLEVKTQ